MKHESDSAVRALSTCRRGIPGFADWSNDGDVGGYRIGDGGGGARGTGFAGE